MKHYRIAIMAVLLTLVGRTFADNLTVSNVEMKAGETNSISIGFNNTSKKYSGFQFDLVLPVGVTIAKKDNGNLNASLNGDRTDDHALSVQDVGSNTYRFLTFSMTNAEFSGTSGAIVNLTLQADESISSGEKTATIISQVFTEAGGTQHKWDNVSFTITIAAAVVPEITADNKSRKYGEDNPELTYTTTATLTGVPQLTTTATKTSPVGEYEIVVERGTVQGDYTSKNGKLTVTKAPLTITAKSYTIKQGETLPTFEAEYSGFKNSETKAVLTTQPTITTTATSASEPGEYEITIGGAEATNYEINYIKGKLTITEADPVTITAKSYTIKYGDDLPTFEFTSEGTTIEGTPAITCEATKTSSVDTYPIVITKGSVTNYNTTFVNGTLTIEKAPLTITAKSYTIKQGEPLPTFEAEYSGFKNNETANVLTKQPTITTTATSASEPGEYEITVSGAEAKNYAISYFKGKLTITEADPVTITAKSYTIKYGDELPTFEFTSEGSTLEGTPAITCEATKTSSVDTYPIVITKGSVTNYNTTFVNGTLTIEKAPLTITAKSYTIKQGEPLPTFEAEYSGFKNNETKAVLSTQPTITTTATSASEPGEYDITIGGAEAQNYEISYVAGKLTITESDGIRMISTEHPVSVFDIQGHKVRSNVTSLEGLPKGVYIINGRKVVIK